MDGRLVDVQLHQWRIMMRKILLAMGVVYAVPMLMGASLLLVITPNPNNVPNSLRGVGTYTIGMNEAFNSFRFEADLANVIPVQTTGATSTAGSPAAVTLSVTANTYNPCRGILSYTFMMMPQSVHPLITSKSDIHCEYQYEAIG
jgi:hypothetical protein